jgi:predicted transcriptional regulator
MERCAAPFAHCTHRATTTAKVMFANGAGYIGVCTVHADAEMTLAEAGRLLGRSPATLRNQARGGRLHARLIGKTYVVSLREVERYRVESLGRPGRRHASSSATS